MIQSELGNLDIEDWAHQWIYKAGQKDLYRINILTFSKRNDIGRSLLF